MKNWFELVMLTVWILIQKYLVSWGLLLISFCNSLPPFSTCSFQLLSPLCIQSHTSPQLQQLKSEVWFPSPQVWLLLMLNMRRLWGPPTSLNGVIVLSFWTQGILVTALLIGADKFHTHLCRLTMTLSLQTYGESIKQLKVPVIHFLQHKWSINWFVL